VRRSFAALLHDELGLRGIPRNTAKPGYYSNYGLSAAHDAVLTRWMRERLMLAVWSKPDGCTYALAAIEAVLLASGDGRRGANLGTSLTMTSRSVQAESRTAATRLPVRARRALGDALQRMRPGAALDTKGYAVRLEDNLLAGVARADIEAAFGAGAGQELEGKMRAPWSSPRLPSTPSLPGSAIPDR
jgi:hypothetical protein